MDGGDGEIEKSLGVECGVGGAGRGGEATCLRGHGLSSSHEALHGVGAAGAVCAGLEVGVLLTLQTVPHSHGTH